MVTSKHITPKCDFCDKPAVYDTQTTLGPWAHVCQHHFDRYSTKINGLYSELKAPVVDSYKCCICGVSKPISEFYKYTDAKGKVRYRCECKQCHLIERKLNNFRKAKLKGKTKAKGGNSSE